MIPRLGRNQEAYSENPFFCGRMAQTIVETMQGHDLKSSEHVVAVLCHYPGQSQPVSGLERGAMEISERMLRSVFLPPWVVGIKKSGALGVMATYPAIDGVPTHASEWILTKILREELGFDGLVLSEGGGIGTLRYEGLARNDQEAAKRAKVAVVVVGENEWRSPNKTGTDGEGYDVATLELTGLQLDLVKAVYETGTPTWTPRRCTSLVTA